MTNNVQLTEEMAKKYVTNGRNSKETRATGEMTKKHMANGINDKGKYKKYINKNGLAK